MFPIPLATSATSITLEKFWDTVLLYHDRPHLVNRKLTAVSQALFCQVYFKSKDVELTELLNKNAILYETRKLESREKITLDFLRNLLESYNKSVRFKEIGTEDFKSTSHGIFISVRVLFPRQKNCQNAVEIVVFNKENNSARFLSVSNQPKLHIAPPFPYTVELTSNFSLRINLDIIEDADTPQAEWLADKLFSKLLKWIEHDSCKSTVQSLSMINVDEYCLTYGRLKEKYGKKLVQEWPAKSGTDPQKYVFEDIAIASYLICLWKDQENVNFVDGGCGNGLLVYLLNQEGFKGCGIDIRRRKIWDIYPKTIQLQVGTVSPTSTFPGSTWLIGNHSDELTPWIPIIALKSSPNTNFFVLPCCPYEFSGKKYIRKNSSQTVYSEYVDYIQDISQKCGFYVSVDKLRIPSTRRTCLVGVQKTENYLKNLEVAASIVQAKTEVNSFVERDCIEKVRNCTQLERTLVTKIVISCVEILLSNPNYVKKENDESWNRGSPLKIPELIKNIERTDLKQLKHECGGLQTLLRNHRYIFEFKEGCVMLRLPVKLEETTKYKDKMCWFFKNHPNGCLYDSDICGYKHD